MAVPKGRTFTQAVGLLSAAGLGPAERNGKIDERSIVLPSADRNVRLIVLRAADVQTYVSYGAAQLGIVGRDMLLESPLEGVYQSLDLGIGRCRLSVAARSGFDYRAAVRGGGRLSVATKFPRLARRHFAAEAVQAEIVRLYGSMELAPLVGMADVIVDLVQTGGTLRANNLVEVATIMEVSTHLIFNQGAFLRRRSALAAVAARLKVAVSNAG